LILGGHGIALTTKKKGSYQNSPPSHPRRWISVYRKNSIGREQNIAIPNMPIRILNVVIIAASVGGQGFIPRPVVS